MRNPISRQTRLVSTRVDVLLVLPNFESFHVDILGRSARNCLAAPMNLKQKILTGIALALFCISLFRSPWEVTMIGVYDGERHTDFIERHYAPVFRPPLPANIASAEFHARLLWPEVLLPWIALGVIYAGAFFLFKKPTDNK